MGIIEAYRDGLEDSATLKTSSRFIVAAEAERQARVVLMRHGQKILDEVVAETERWWESHWPASAATHKGIADYHILLALLASIRWNAGGGS